MRTIEVKLYEFDELDDEAKKRAVDWYREASTNDEWWSSYDDFDECATRLGITINRAGDKRSSLMILFTGFWSQGDGACFVGSWTYKPDAMKAITDHAPLDTTLKDIAYQLYLVQSRHPTLKLSAKVKHSGHYAHSGCTDIEVFDDVEGDYAPDDAHDDVKRELRRFMDWMYEQLERQYEYMNSYEMISDNIRANEYEFYVDGRRARES